MDALTHKPDGASAEGNAGPKRSLILAGGGIRVAYQAGVLRALIESGLSFFHVDGTSGGIINLAMLFSGLSPVEMCNRWRTLKVKDFVSFLPLEKYLKVYDLPAMGDADGIRDAVFPHLGIDIQKINAARGMAGTFNVCNYTRKTNEAVPHTEIDLDLLIAGISLPIFMPPVRKGETWYTDSVWIQDANLMEAVRRGAEELWIVWCIGNTGEYKNGFLNQYVHMIEMSANGALFGEFERIDELNGRIVRGDSPYGQTGPIRLHLIKPEYPLPLDPDLFLGKIDTATLIDRGYADAKRYLEQIKPEGLPFSPEVTKMKEETTIGLTFRETMAGGFALGVSDPWEAEKKGEADGTPLAMHATILIRDIYQFIKDPGHAGEITGHIDFPPFGEKVPAKSGVFNLFSPADDPKMRWMIYELGFEHAGKDYYLAGKKEVRDDFGFDLWKDTTTLLTRLHEGKDQSGPVIGAGVLTLSLTELKNLLTTVRATGTDSMTEGAKAIGAFGRFFLGELWDRYMK
ncbi:MAG: patatin-like phospholipase family protein [Candidatus Manganitrophaceae bacterium]